MGGVNLQSWRYISVSVDFQYIYLNLLRNCALMRRDLARMSDEEHNEVLQIKCSTFWSVQITESIRLLAACTGLWLFLPLSQVWHKQVWCA